LSNGGCWWRKWGKTQWDAVQRGNLGSRPPYGAASLFLWALLLRNSNSNQMFS